ncbi:hypothetical protein AB0K18_47920 [Nonomuraea sp. NPDC049421]|uniref:hypothetical protein n=1 Tax=Nonomuraea sp. NPDC049421 TaxID=3155275 RepID=UPI00341D44CD
MPQLRATTSASCSQVRRTSGETAERTRSRAAAMMSIASSSRTPAGAPFSAANSSVRT